VSRPAPQERPRASALRSAGAVVVVAALVAGCGGNDEKARFGEAFRPVNSQLVALGGSVGQALQNAPKTTDAELARSFMGFVTQLQGIRARIVKLDPPRELEPQVRRLSAAVSRLLVDLGGIAAAARTHSRQAFRTAVAALVRDSPPAGDARRVLARKTGAAVGP
jgi:outer membrane murein-binding lipoprotein Lpp